MNVKYTSYKRPQKHISHPVPRPSSFRAWKTRWKEWNFFLSSQAGCLSVHLPYLALPETEMREHDMRSFPLFFFFPFSSHQLLLGFFLGKNDRAPSSRSSESVLTWRWGRGEGRGRGRGHFADRPLACSPPLVYSTCLFCIHCATDSREALLDTCNDRNGVSEAMIGGRWGGVFRGVGAGIVGCIRYNTIRT